MAIRCRSPRFLTIEAKGLSHERTLVEDLCPTFGGRATLALSFQAVKGVSVQSTVHIVDHKKKGLMAKLSTSVPKILYKSTVFAPSITARAGLADRETVMEILRHDQAVDSKNLRNLKKTAQSEGSVQRIIELETSKSAGTAPGYYRIGKAPIVSLYEQAPQLEGQILYVAINFTASLRPVEQRKFRYVLIKRRDGSIELVNLCENL